MVWQSGGSNSRTAVQIERFLSNSRRRVVLLLDHNRNLQSNGKRTYTRKVTRNLVRIFASWILLSL